MEKDVKTTPLHKWHCSNGANMADFGGYEMPLWYGSAKNEHLAVLTSAGVFDTSHMAVVMVNGKGAFDLLQYRFTNDLAGCVGLKKMPLSPGRCVYGAFLNDRGEALDDAIVFQLAENRYMVVVNAGMGEAIARHLDTSRDKSRVEIIDMTDHLGKMDIQGPLSAKILKHVLADPDTVFEKMPYFSFKGFFDPEDPLSESVKLKDGTPILLSRTGYTGEFGFEIFIEPNHIENLWLQILKAGASFNVMACGLAARDSLRAGAVLPLSHQDIGHWPFVNHPWPFALCYGEDGKTFTKPFVGSRALENIKLPEYTLAFAGNDLRKVSIPGDVIDNEGNTIGMVLTCATDMGISRKGDKIYSITSPDIPDGMKIKGLCCGFIKTLKKLSAGDIVLLKDNHRKISVTIVDDIRPDRTARLPINAMLS